MKQARQQYAEAVKAMTAGSPSATMQQFTFEVPRDYKGARRTIDCRSQLMIKVL